MKKILFLALLISSTCFLHGQEPITQSIRGTVVDAVTGYALAGANVILLATDPVIGTSTDQNGNFLLEEILLGRQSIEVSYVGYTTRVIPNLFVSAGKNTQVQAKIPRCRFKWRKIPWRWRRLRYVQ